eukprot:TRINITY_DN71616_c0_g1_i1.p1 TRINITY_DN71616_c0_g1~~TRINITY_DN71616_c0_g1_i1.p1  ORF type:complete len:188 (-),score=26.52 TRINITY_DN71616_c0_g1_i1:13-576(-)
MAVRALGWLSDKLGIDVTGEKESQSKTVFDSVGEKVFGTTEKTDVFQEPEWGYQYNEITGRWEPTADAPENIKKENETRLHELQQPQEPKYVPPPPTMAGSPINYQQRDWKSPQYADHFHTYSSSALPASPASLNSPVETPMPPPRLASVVQEAPTNMLHFTAPAATAPAAPAYFTPDYSTPFPGTS